MESNNNLILSKSQSIDSGVCICDEKGQILFALNEERVSRKKLTSKYPKLSKEITELHFKKKAKIITAGYFNHFGISENLYQAYYSDNFFSFIPKKEIFLEIARKGIILLSKLLFRNRVEHHLCHAASAYYTSGLKKSLIITMDAYGDGHSTTVSVGTNNKIKFLEKHVWGCSPAQLYARITEYLGFKSHRHEGKVTGLAAYGNPEKTIRVFRKLLWFDKKKIESARFLIRGYNKERFDELLGSFSREDIAAGLQKRCEEVTCKFISFWVEKTNIKDICLSGGLFANVKINQRIHELPNVNSVYVFPHMGDGGLAIGAALAYTKPMPTKLETIYLGPEYSDEETKKELDKNKLKYEKFENIEEEIAKLLAKGKVVARFNEKMEYGPRALGNRSILYQTTDKTVNDWLNKKLKRTEFMPFAPATLWEHKEECYENTKGAEHTAKYMTITFNCTEQMKKQSPGVVHIDGTARPQLVTKEDNKSFHKIIKEYHKITNIPSIINTSFNIHEEPIVMSPKDAINAYKESKLDNLAIGQYLI
ncbi:MAG: hypothetical protein KKA51_01860 [Nanoarchaeota archaeon]|nr:hypothetical protein [Nanoarchaeota archaeon]